MILLINFIVMSCSFLKICFMNYEVRVVNYNLCVFIQYASFLLAWIVCLTSSLIYRSWYLLFYVESMKEINPGKYCSTSSSVFSLFVMLYIFWGIEVCIVLSTFQSFVYLCKCCSDLGQIKNQLMCMLCKETIIH